MNSYILSLKKVSGSSSDGVFVITAVNCDLDDKDCFVVFILSTSIYTSVMETSIYKTDHTDDPTESVSKFI